MLPGDEKKARELLLSRAQYHVEEGVQGDKPQAESIRVAYNRIRHYHDSLPNKLWPTRARSNKRPATGSSSEEDEDVTKQQVNIQDIDNPWKHRLRPR